MPRITSKEIVNHFIETFLPDKVLTGSEYKMMMFKLKNLRKVVKDYLVEAEIDTKKSVEKIIMEAIDYGAMTGRKFTSIASIGYDILPKSITYWKQFELKQAEINKKRDQAIKEAKSVSKLEENVNSNNERLATEKIVPSWFTDDEDEYY